MNQGTPQPRVDRFRGHRFSAYFVAPVFFALAAWFWFGPELETLPEANDTSVHASLLSTEPHRTILGDPPRVHVNGFDRTCMECHRLFQSEEAKTQKLLQHEHIRMEHGPNVDCYICHDAEDRDQLTLGNGVTTKFTDVVSLCARCHPSIVDDWKLGSHGRTNGYWSADRGEVRKLVCTECHDPHAPRTPAMSKIEPLPAPNGWRQGNPAPDHHDSHGHKRDPLREALRRASEHHESHDK